MAIESQAQLSGAVVSAGRGWGCGRWHWAPGPYAIDWRGWLTLTTIAIAFGANACTNLPAEVVFWGGLAVLLMSGILDTDTALTGFSNAGMVTVGVLYVVVARLQQTGGLTWFSQQVLGLPWLITVVVTPLAFPF